MKKIIEVKVENFKCEYCGHEEYSVFNPYSSKRQIYCNKCGKIQENVDYEVKNELLRNKIINFFFKCKNKRK